MFDNKTYIPFGKEWRNVISALDDEQCGKLIKMYINYSEDATYCGTSDDQMVNGLFYSVIKPSMDRMEEAFTGKVLAGKQFGRKKTVDDISIYKACQDNPGASAKAIADVVGCSVDSIYHSESWRNRKNSGWLIAQF